MLLEELFGVLALPVLLSLLMGIFAGMLVWLTSYLQAQRRKKRAPTLEDTIQRLAKDLQAAAASISQIEMEINIRQKMAEKLNADVRRSEEISRLNKDQVEAIAQTLRTQIAAETRRSNYIHAGIAFAIAFIFFLIGLAIGGR